MEAYNSWLRKVKSTLLQDCHRVDSLSFLINSTGGLNPLFDWVWRKLYESGYAPCEAVDVWNADPTDDERGHSMRRFWREMGCEGWQAAVDLIFDDWYSDPYEEHDWQPAFLPGSTWTELYRKGYAPAGAVAYWYQTKHKNH